ncbi:MAG: glycosyltransferase family 39 protein [Solirubrobacterales bacterium]
MAAPGTWRLQPSRRVALAANREMVVLTGIIAAAVIVRFATLGHQSYDHDEAVSAWRVLRGGLGGTLNAVASSERSPPLYYLLAWVWAQLFGTGEVGLRSLSAVTGVLTVPAAYLAARELASGRAGLIAAALVAFNPYLVWYAQEARSYALLVLFVAWGLYFFARCLKDPSRRNLGLWAAASALALCSHYFAVFPIAAEGAWLIVRGWPRRGPVVALGATAVAGLALLPLAIVQEGSGRRNHFATVPFVHRAAGTVFEFIASPEPGGLVGTQSVRYFRGAMALGGVILAGVALVLLLRRSTPRERRGGLTVAAIAGAALIVPFALAAAGPDFVDPRNLIGALVPLLVAAGIGFGCARAGRIGLASAGAAILLFVAVLGGVYASGQMQRPNWRDAAAAMGRPSGPRVLVVPRNGNEPIAYYRDAKEFRPPRFRAARVREIDVLSTTGAVSPPRGGFQLIERRGLAPCCTLSRFRARRPIRVQPQDVSGHRILNERSTVLIEGAR